MQSDDREPKHVDTTTSTIQKSSQITESYEIACFSTDKPLESTSSSSSKPSSSTTSLLSPSTSLTFSSSSSSISSCSSSTSPLPAT
ncbi:unnamed protein product, partial [Rotaria sordida]